MIARALLAFATLVLVAGIAIWRGVEPPRLLSWADAVAGGGRGVSLVGDAVPFGTAGQTLDVWRRDGGDDKAGKNPVVIFWYGGGWVKGDRRAYAFAARAYASRGFVVVVPDYRKVPTVRFPAFLQDGAGAVRWVRDHVAEYGGDPARIGLAGHSAGAYTVAMLALDPRWLHAEGVDPRIVKAAVGLSGPYDFFPFDTKRSIDAMQGVKDPLMTQPIHFARADAAPMLLVTSSRDTEVRPRNAIRLARRLQALGAPVTLINYDGLTHEEVAMALSRPFRDKAPVLTDSAAFLHRQLDRP